VRGRRIGFWYRVAVIVVKPLATLFTRRLWEGFENLPPEGGVIVVANHYSHADPLTLAHAVYDNGRVPRFLAKAELFHVPIVGAVMRGAAQIPVNRRSPDAAAALSAAVESLRNGECVVIYPEGTTTDDPDRWPMRSRTGIARLALSTRAPVLPLAQWGAQRLHDKQDGWRLRRVFVHTRLGAPIDLSRYEGSPQSAAVLREVTELIMGTIRQMLGDLRGESPPDEVFGAPLLEADERRSA
jgi:1-acyl-sn-glycerol-3-phosphate acyltransferase